MPSSETAKTKSAPRRHWIQILVPSLVILVGGFLSYFVYASVHANLQSGEYTLLVGGNAGLEQNRTHNVLASKPWTYKLTPARTEQERQQGLSGTKSLGHDAGMLFIFGIDREQCFWMKDMNYPLDIIWASSDKKVTHIEKNLSPKTYPQEYCASGQYVIELNAGQADASHMSQGQTLHF